MDQIDAIAPGRSKASDGTKGDAAHALTDSAHNPQDSGDADAPGNPDNQVDAFDVTHDPAKGCDIGVMWEGIRASRDRRAKFAIFNKRCFSNYPVSGYAAFTWRPYSGKNDHSKHGHIEIDDRYHDQVHAWQIGDAMNAGQGYVLHVMNYRLQAVLSLKDVVTVPKSTHAGVAYAGFSEPNILAATLKAQANPDVDETQLAGLLAPTIRDIFADIDAETPTTEGLTEAEVLAAIEDAFGRARFTVTPSV